MSNKRTGEIEMAHSKRSNVMRETQNDRPSVYPTTCAEQPIDLTKKVTDSDKKNDTVVSIDSEEDACDDIGHQKLIHKIQEELRNEETKLIFLKQLRHNQRQHLIESSGMQKANMMNGKSVPVNTVQAHGGAPAAHSKVSAPHVQQHSNQSQQQHHQQQQQQQQQQQPQHQQQQSAKRANAGNNQASRSSNITNNASTASVAPRQNPVSNPPAASTIAHQTSTPSTPAKPTVLDEPQKQAARGALRRQLEKSLLAIPSPKPLPPELSFIPSLISNDFVKLLGLEEVVKMLMDIQRQEKRDVKYVFNPFRCSQCKSDFTPVWKREKPGSKNVICEQCVTSNQKRSLRQEHTAKLKGAFMKAAEQQQDLEEQLKKNIIPPSLTPFMPSSLQPGHGSAASGGSRQHHSANHSTPTGATTQSQAHHRNESSHRNDTATSAGSSLLSGQFPNTTNMSSPLINMAYIQQQLAALANQANQSNQGLGAFGLGSAAVAAAAAALTPQQRQMLLDQISQQAKSYNWKN